MDPILEQRVKQYHPWLQNLIAKQAVIYQPFCFNRNEIPYDPKIANRRYHKLRCQLRDNQ